MGFLKYKRAANGTLSGTVLYIFCKDRLETTTNDGVCGRRIGLKI